MQGITEGLFDAMFCSYRSGTLAAYLDPGSGSMALQLLIGGVVAVLATSDLLGAAQRLRAAEEGRLTSLRRRRLRARAP
jgi:hypothetical protein